MRVKVKICGLTRQEDLDASVQAGADAVGFVVGTPSSPRNLELETAEKLLRRTPSSVESVLVVVADCADQVANACVQLKPNAVQIHGDNPIDASLLRQRLPNLTLIRAVNANSNNALSDALAASETFDAVHLDSHANGQYGGTGLVHDWTLSKSIKTAIHPKKMILAGGLTPDNVADAVQTVQPYAVDVSSGVELQPGIKSHKKIIEFVRNAKSVKL